MPQVEVAAAPIEESAAGEAPPEPQDLEAVEEAPARRPLGSAPVQSPPQLRIERPRQVPLTPPPSLPEPRARAEPPPDGAEN
jgi:hypothetical protein